VFSPEPYGAGALTFREHGPLARFERAAGRLAVAAEYELGDPAIDHDLQLAACILNLPFER
jgi:hypothetical protein